MIVTPQCFSALRVLKDNESEINGTIKLIFQPAEEGGAGGKMMREQGVLEDPDVERIFGLHVSDKLPTGTLASKEGTLLAPTSSIRILVSGNGGHAAMPHLTVDPVVTGSKIVVEPQTLVSRELDPLESGVISITMANAGSATNVIPSSMELQGTIRSLTSDGITRLKDKGKRGSRSNSHGQQVHSGGNLPWQRLPSHRQ